LFEHLGGISAVPLYEYKCLKCGRTTEKIENVSGPHLKKCPHCGGKVEALISAPAIQFKGSGWYVTDYAGKAASGDGGAGEKTGGESKDAAKEAAAKDGSSTDKSASDSSSKESTAKETGKETKKPAKRK
jgi:putative FmdB family regulatory protein